MYPDETAKSPVNLKTDNEIGRPVAMSAASNVLDKAMSVRHKSHFVLKRLVGDFPANESEQVSDGQLTSAIIELDEAIELLERIAEAIDQIV